MHRSIRTALSPAAWGLTVDDADTLMVDGCSTVDLARRYGTPVHVVHQRRLQATAAACIQAFANVYPGPVSIHYAFKCNAIPGVVRLLRQAGLRAEVCTPFELLLARQLGYAGCDIVVNGPGKTRELLERCVESGVRYVVVDALAEFDVLERHAAAADTTVDVLLRVNPDYVPRGMSRGTATGSRRWCAFGLDLRGGEVDRALDLFQGTQRLRFRGFHFHIGTGIRHPDDYRRAVLRLGPLVERTRARGLAVSVVDIGGGLAAPTTREMTTLELLAYQGWGRLPTPPVPTPTLTFASLADSVTVALGALFPPNELPELLVEPGRSIVSANQLLLLTVREVKTRRGVGSWYITDGGVSTVATPTYYEYHEILPCNGVHRPRTERVQLLGPACFAGDILCRNKPMPVMQAGDVLAVMDAGAYFTAMESSFGFARPPVVVVADARHVLLRRRESLEDATARDIEFAGIPGEEHNPGVPMPSLANSRAALRFAVVRHGTHEVRDRVADALIRCLEARGHVRRAPDEDIDWVLNLTDAHAPQCFRRRSHAVFVVSLVALEHPAGDMRALTYSTLVRSLSNLLVCAVPCAGGQPHTGVELHFTTPEVGYYHHPFDAARACDNILPIVSARMLLDNRLSPNLPERLRTTSPIVERLRDFGRELDRLGVLPTPFPLRDLLSDEQIEHLYELFQVKGISYGNLSARETVPELGDCTFWMTARGVDKARLMGIGRDVLLVTGYDGDAGAMLVSVPPDHDGTARASVDAIEHYSIYRAFPDVGAIVHVHAWMDDVPCTRQNYPCGTIDLAEEVVRLLAQQEHPARTAVGLKNHGLTITGPGLEDIFDRIRGRLRPQVPMFR